MFADCFIGNYRFAGKTKGEHSKRHISEIPRLPIRTYKFQWSRSAGTLRVTSEACKQCLRCVSQSCGRAFAVEIMMSSQGRWSIVKLQRPKRRFSCKEHAVGVYQAFKCSADNPCYFRYARKPRTIKQKSVVMFAPPLLKSHSSGCYDHNNYKRFYRYHPSNILLSL